MDMAVYLWAATDGYRDHHQVLAETWSQAKDQ